MDRAMRRPRNDGPKVWHNPELDTFARRRSNGSPGARADDARDVQQHRAALEALFAPKGEPNGNARPAPEGARPRDGAKAAGRIVLAPPPQSDPTTIERQKLLAKLLAVSGRPAVTKAANEFLRAGHTFPNEQDVYLQLLEHTSEDHVRSAIDALGVLLAGEPPKRRNVLESRLRRIEEFADEQATRAAAEKLRRQVSGRC
jgi:hypothetical protein